MRVQYLLQGPLLRPPGAELSRGRDGWVPETMGPWNHGYGHLSWAEAEMVGSLKPWLWVPETMVMGIYPELSWGRDGWVPETMVMGIYPELRQRWLGPWNHGYGHLSWAEAEMVGSLKPWLWASILSWGRDGWVPETMVMGIYPELRQRWWGPWNHGYGYLSPSTRASPARYWETWIFSPVRTWTWCGSVISVILRECGAGAPEGVKGKNKGIVFASSFL